MSLSPTPTTQPLETVESSCESTIAAVHARLVKDCLIDCADTADCIGFR
jgi:hypothetical protein